MAIKEQKTFENIEEVKPATADELEDLGLEFEYSTSNGSTWKLDYDNLEKIPINDLPVGSVVTGMPEFVRFDNTGRTNTDGSPRKWDSICVRLSDIEEVDEYGEQQGEFLECYLPCPRPDAAGNISNVFGNGFYHGTFNLIYSYLRTLNENNVLDSKGNIKNTIKRINLIKLLEKLNNYSYMEFKVMKGANGYENYLTFMITKMK